MRELDNTLAALADPTRLAMLRLLAQEPRRSTDVADALDVSRAVASRHLRILARAGLVEERPVPEDARVRIYAARRAPLLELRGFLDELDAFWGDQLQSFKAFAESQR